MGWGATILPPEVLSSSFFRSVMIEEAIGVEVADVAGAEPAIGVETLGIIVGLVPVAGKDRRPADQQFAVFGEFQLDVGQGLADRAHAMGNGRVEGQDGRGLSKAIALPEGDADGGKPLGGVDAERRAAGDKNLDPAAECLADLGIDQLVGQLPEERGGAAAVVDRIADGPSRSWMAQARMRFLTGESAARRSTSWRIFSKTRGTPTKTVGLTSRMAWGSLSNCEQ